MTMLAALAVLAWQWAAPPTEELQAMIDQRVALEGSAGLVLGVVEGGVPRVVSTQGLDGDTVFEIGSVSKVLTTTVLAEMVLRGELSLDDSVQSLLPEEVRLPTFEGLEITLLDLATASSAIPRMPEIAPADPANPYADYTVEQMYEDLNELELTRAPGSAYEYSNWGMGLLGHVLARRGGVSYETLVIARLLAPLGMDDTRIGLTEDMRERLAQPHGPDLEPASSWDIPTLAGAGAWRSTVNDMVKLLDACVDAAAGESEDSSPERRRVLGALVTAMEPRRPTGVPDLSIGLGWHVIARGESQVVWHNGETGGYHSFLGCVPQSGAAVVVLSNSALDIDDLGLHVLDPTIPLRPMPALRPTVEVGDDVLQSYVGRYEMTPSFAIDVTRDGARLFAQATSQMRYRVFPSSPTRFFYKVVEAELEFTEEGLVLHQNGLAQRARKVP